MMIDKNTWIISDTHLGHANMVKLCNRPLNFNEKIVEKWEKLVKPEDIILHLGDLSIFFGPTSKMWANRASELPGEKYLIRGNHDKFENYPGFAIVPNQIATIEQTRILFSHEPTEKKTSWDINIHGHMHGNTHHDYPYPLDHHMDVGLDTAFAQAFGWGPIRLGDILKYV